MDIRGDAWFDEATINNIASALNQQGYIIIRQIFSHNILKNLQQRVQCLASEHWQPAGIGRNYNYQLNNKIRSDKIFWLCSENPVDSAFLSCMENLRHSLNRRLFMGLFDYESHFAYYPKGAYYKKHLDALKGHNNRVLSTILYLNNNWQVADAGALKLYDKDDKLIQCILPEAGTFVIFLSQQFPHEVIKAKRQRFSLTGWFRVNSSNSQCVDTAS